MKASINYDWGLWALGVIQPARADECISFIDSVFGDSGISLNLMKLEEYFQDWNDSGLIVQVHKGDKLYSLTGKGNASISEDLRKERDRIRIGLMKSHYHANVKTSEGVSVELDGDSPSIDVSTASKEVSRPVTPGRVSSQTKLIRHPSRSYWPRLSEQLNFRVGLKGAPSDVHSTPFRYCSFRTLRDLAEASSEQLYENDMSHGQLALAMGVSSQLLNYIRKKKSLFYRKFEIGKKGGGERRIMSPRVYLKVIQYWIKTYFFPYLEVHEACHAYLPERSIITNANLHIRKKFVGNLDIENFFGSINTKAVERTLFSNGVGPKLSVILADLLTIDNHLPQGAPTSPGISNAFLFSLDQVVYDFAILNNLIYTRYADDLTLSGDCKESILDGFNLIRSTLKELQLSLNEDKTRIASSDSSQRVTGLIVNERVRPPRKLRRQVRAMFYNAKNLASNEEISMGRLNGYISYFHAFESLRYSKELKMYIHIMEDLNSKTK